MGIKIECYLASCIDIGELELIILDARLFISLYGSPQWSVYYPTKEKLLKGIKNNEIYKIVIEDKIIGCFQLVDYDSNYDVIEGNWLNDEKYVAIHSVALYSLYHNKGYMKQVYEFINTYAKINNKKSLRVDTHKLNEPMIKSLIKNGFVLVGVIYLNNKDTKENNHRLAFEKLI